MQAHTYLMTMENLTIDKKLNCGLTDEKNSMTNTPKKIKIRHHLL